MAEDKNKKPEELNDELLDEVSGGAGPNISSEIANKFGNVIKE